MLRHEFFVFTSIEVFVKYFSSFVVTLFSQSTDSMFLESSALLISNPEFTMELYIISMLFLRFSPEFAFIFLSDNGDFI